MSKAPAKPADALPAAPASEPIAFDQAADLRMRALELAMRFRRDNSAPEEAIAVAQKFYDWTTTGTAPADPAKASGVKA